MATISRTKCDIFCNVAPAAVGFSVYVNRLNFQPVGEVTRFLWDFLLQGKLFVVQPSQPLFASRADRASTQSTRRTATAESLRLVLAELESRSATCSRDNYGCERLQLSRALTRELFLFCHEFSGHSEFYITVTDAAANKAIAYSRTESGKRRSYAGRTVCFNQMI